MANGTEEPPRLLGRCIDFVVRQKAAFAQKKAAAERQIDVVSEAQRVLGGTASGALEDSARRAIELRVARAEIITQYCAVATCILTALGSGAIALAYLQWQDDLIARKNKHSLRYVERMLEEPVYSASFHAGSTLAAAGDQGQKDLMTFAESYDPSARKSIITLLIFYDSVAKCMEKELCSRDVLEPFFDTSDKLIFKASCHFIMEARKGGDTNFVRSAEAFFGLICKDIPPEPIPTAAPV